MGGRGGFSRAGPTPKRVKRRRDLARIRDGLAAAEAAGTRLWTPLFLALLAEALALAGEIEEGLAALDDALAKAAVSAERGWDAEIHRLRGELTYQAGSRAVFLYAFAKNERENIDPDELLTLREIGAGWLVADAQQIARAVDEGILQEVTYGDETEAT